MSKVILIACMNENRVIGNMAGELPWSLPEDMRWFKNQTKGNVVIMGRKTHESLVKHVKDGLLPERYNIIVSKSMWKHARNLVHSNLSNDPVFYFSRHAIARDLPVAIVAAKGYPPYIGRDVYVIGGESIYRQSMPHADEIHLTEIQCPVDDGATFFPEFYTPHFQYKLVEEGISEKDSIRYRIGKYF